MHSELVFIALLVGAAVLGFLLVLPIGGADMPVVISLLNAFTGLSAAATGVALDNSALIVAGMLVGASGTLLTQQMAAAMNRSVRAIVPAASAGRPSCAAGAAARPARRARPRRRTSAIQLAYAQQVVIVPGYGLAVSQAQHALRELTKLLGSLGVTVKYAVHPVAGRMPGHMNVLLAEAEVPYDQLVEMDEINAEFPRTDVALVIGANDVVNPDARTNPQSPLFGMPILDVDHARSIIVLKRSMRPGYAGIENPLFFDPKTAMLFGDAKASIVSVTDELNALGVAPAAEAGKSRTLCERRRSLSGIPLLCGSCKEPVSRQEVTCWRCGNRVRGSSHRGGSSRRPRTRRGPQHGRRTEPSAATRSLRRGSARRRAIVIPPHSHRIAASGPEPRR